VTTIARTAKKAVQTTALMTAPNSASTIACINGSHHVKASLFKAKAHPASA